MTEAPVLTIHEDLFGLHDAWPPGTDQAERPRSRPTASDRVTGSIGTTASAQTGLEFEELFHWPDNGTRPAVGPTAADTPTRVLPHVDWHNAPTVPLEIVGGIPVNNRNGDTQVLPLGVQTSREAYDLGFRTQKERAWAKLIDIRRKAGQNSGSAAKPYPDTFGGYPRVVNEIIRELLQGDTLLDEKGSSNVEPWVQQLAAYYEGYPQNTSDEPSYPVGDLAPVYLSLYNNDGVDATTKARLYEVINKGDPEKAAKWELQPPVDKGRKFTWRKGS